MFLLVLLLLLVLCLLPVDPWTMEYRRAIVLTFAVWRVVVALSNEKLVGERVFMLMPSMLRHPIVA